MHVSKIGVQAPKKMNRQNQTKQSQPSFGMYFKLTKKAAQELKKPEDFNVAYELIRGIREHNENPLNHLLSESNLHLDLRTNLHTYNDDNITLIVQKREYRFNRYNQEFSNFLTDPAKYLKQIHDDMVYKLFKKNPKELEKIIDSETIK